MHPSTIEAQTARPVAILPSSHADSFVPVLPATVIPFPRPEATLIAEAGTRIVTRDELKLITTPQATRTHHPVSHHDLASAIIETLGFRHLHVTKDEYAVSDDGMRMFGLMETDVEWSGMRFAIGIRNGNDRSMRLAITCGSRVKVCSNMMFLGNFTPLLARHSAQFHLIDQVSIAIDRIQRGYEPLTKQIETWQNRVISDDEARVILYKAFVEKGIPVPQTLLKTTHKAYFEPEYQEFAPRSLWSLSNAFTSAFKELDPLKKYPVTAKLGGFLTQFE